MASGAGVELDRGRNKCHVERGRLSHIKIHLVLGVMRVRQCVCGNALHCNSAFDRPQCSRFWVDVPRSAHNAPYFRCAWMRLHQKRLFLATACGST